MKSLNFGNLLNGFLLPNCPSAQVPDHSSERCDIFEQLISLRILIHCLIESTRRWRRKLCSAALPLSDWGQSWLLGVDYIWYAMQMQWVYQQQDQQQQDVQLGRAALHFIICMRSVFVVCKSQVIGVKQLPGTWPLRRVTEGTLNLTKTKPLWSCNNIYYLKAEHQNRTATTKREHLSRGAQL